MGDILYGSEVNNFENTRISLNNIMNQQLEQDLNILINSVASSSTLNNYDDMYVDIISDANGTSNTINITNTTAIFDTNLYKNFVIGYGGGIISTDNTSGASVPSDSYVLVKTQTVLPSKNVEKGTIVVTPVAATGTGYAIFVYDDNTTSTGSSFGSNSSNSGTALTSTNSIPSYGKVKEVRWYMKNDFVAGGENQITGQSLIYEWFNSQGLLKVVETNQETITANPINHQLFAHYEIIKGSGVVNYDISFDGGVTWDLNQPLNTLNTSGSTNLGSNMVIKINLNGVGELEEITIRDYGVMLYY